MAEYALIVSPLIDLAVSKAAAFAFQGINRRWGLENELKELSQSLTLIQGVLVVAEKWQATNPAVWDWLRRLHDIATEAVDVLDEYDDKITLIEFETPGRKVRKTVRTIFSASLCKIVRKIRKIKDSLVKVREDAVFVQLINSTGQSHPTTSQHHCPETGPVLPANLTVTGKDDDVLGILMALDDDALEILMALDDNVLGILMALDDLRSN